MTAVVAWLLGTKAGRWLASLAAAGAVAAGILVRAYGAGREAEESRTTRDSLESLRSRNRTDEAVDRMGDLARRDKLARWVRDDRA